LILLTQKLSVIDDIAPMKVRKNSGRQKAPWRNSHTTAVQNIKRQCRRAERMWRKTKVHYNFYKDSIYPFHMEICKARRTFSSQIL